MAKVYTVRPGDRRQIGGFGEATNETPALVPETVADELAVSEVLRVERDAPGSATGEPEDQEVTDAPLVAPGGDRGGSHGGAQAAPEGVGHGRTVPRA